MEKIKAKLYNIYKACLLKDINSEQAVEKIIDYMDYVDNKTAWSFTKHMNSLLVRLVVKLLLKINPSHKLLYKYLESEIVDNSITNQTRYYLYHVVEEYFPSKIENLQDFILRFLPTYFSDNIEFDGIEVIKAGLEQFLFLTYNTLGTYFSNQPFKWNYNFNGFSNGNILIVHKNNDPYINEKFPVQYSYAKNMIINGRLYFDNKKYSVRLLNLGFSLQILKLIEKDFEATQLFFSFPLDPDIPIKISYKDSNILLFLFKDPKPLVGGTTPKVIKKRKRPIDFDTRSLYFNI